MKPYLKEIFRLAAQQKKLFLPLVVIMVIEVAVRLAQPYMYKVVVDDLTFGLTGSFTQEILRELMFIIIIWMGLSIADNLLRAQMLFLSWKIGNHSSESIHLNGFRKLLRLDYQRHVKTHSSQLTKIVDNADNSMWEMTNWWLSSFIPAGLGFVGMLIIALSVSWQMTLVSIAVIPVYLVLVQVVFSKAEAEQHAINKLWDEKHEHMSDQVGNIMTYKLNPDEKAFFLKQKSYSDRAVQKQNELNKRWRFIEMMNPDAIARFLVMGMGVWMVKEGNITLGTMFMFMGLLNEILTPLHILGEKIPQYSRRARQIDKYLNLINEPVHVLDPEKPRKLDAQKVKGLLEFKNVSFRYGKGFGVKNLNFSIQPGEQVALVGHSGAGKSTLIGLLVRLMDPTEGEILLDGVDIREYRQEEFRSLIGVVQQENSLYNENILQNIGYGNFKASTSEIIAAAKVAVVHPFIKNLPKSYETLIGEKGVRLSGGEKQRLAIARAILKKPKIVILDEPTSALDSLTEAVVQKGLDKLVHERTSLTIAHRLSTVKHAHKILLIEKGQIAEQGTHGQLMKSSNIYRRMVEHQTQGFLAEDL